MFEKDNYSFSNHWYIHNDTACLGAMLELQPSPLVSLRPLIKFLTYNMMAWSKYWISFVCKNMKKYLKRELLFLKAIVQDGGVVISLVWLM